MRRHRPQTCTALLSLLVCAASAAAPEPHGGLNSIRRYAMPGVFNSGAMTTVVHCTNFGSTSARILTAFYNFDGVFVCSAGADSVAPGRTLSMAVEPIASLANVATCFIGSGTTISQGMAYVSGDVTTSLRFQCSGQVIDEVADPPASMVRLSMYTAAGTPLRDIIFANGFEQ
jgi:hypothetical protein